MGYGLWDVGCGMGYGEMWDMVYGMWDVGCGIWDMAHMGVWDVGCGVWDVGYGIMDVG